MSRLLFLSHSGVDTEAAKALKARILAAPAAHGLSVWFDKDDLRAGEPWQSQLEAAIGRSHAFAVYVGSKGVVNWVEAEVRLALNRAITDPEYRFVPILAGAAPRPEALPGFVQQFQGVFDVELKPEQFDLLLRAVLGGAEAGQLQLESEPFFGLRAIDEGRNHLFFGRSKETEALVALVHRTPLVLVTGDSGSGKSSLVRAGLVPRFRGGALALLDGARPEDAIWHAIVTRPRNQPFRQLGDAVDEAAKSLGLSLADRGTLAAWAASGQIDQVRRALRCDLPPERVQILLVVDQFEELLTITPPEIRTPFIDLLLDLSDPAAGRNKVVLTMRHDYANLCNAVERLKAHLDADDRRARFLLGRMTDDGLRRIVTEPLRLAAVASADREALATEVLHDVGERPGDLALVQMALSETWQARDQHGGDLLRAYAAVGRVEGALAQAAERVRTETLDASQREILDSILLRLLRLGDTGGATRRLAARSEFDDERWLLVQKLASEDGKRLVLLRGSIDRPTVEIAHEALVTAWPYFQNLLQQVADDKRMLDTLTPRAQAWAGEEDQGARKNRLATGADLEIFAGLRERRKAWLSGDEGGFVEASVRAEHTRQRRRKWQFRGAIAASLLFLVVALGAVWFYFDAEAQAERARNALEEVDRQKTAAETARNEAEERADQLQRAVSRVLGATAQRLLDQVMTDETAPAVAALAATAWRTYPSADAWNAIQRLPILGSILTIHDWNASVWTLAFSPDGRLLVIGSRNGIVQLLEIGNGKIVANIEHGDGVLAAAFSPDSRLLATASEDKIARLIDTANGKVVQSIAHDGVVTAVAFSPDGRLLATASKDKIARLIDTANGKVVRSIAHGGAVTAVAFNPDGRLLATGSEDKVARLIDAASGKVVQSIAHDGMVTVVAFDPDGRLLATASKDMIARLIDTANGKVVWSIAHGGTVTAVAFSPDGRLLATGSGDGFARLITVTAGKEVARIDHEGPVIALTFSPDGHLLATGNDSWPPTFSVTVKLVAITANHDIAGIAVDKSSRTLMFSGDGRMIMTDKRLIDVETLAIRRFEHDDDVRAVRLSSDKKLLAISKWGDSSKLIELPAVREVARIGDDDSSIVAWDFSPDGVMAATAHNDFTVRLSDIANGRNVKRIDGGERIADVLFSPDGRLLAIITDSGVVRLIEAATGREVSHFNTTSRDVVFSPDGNRIVADDDRLIDSATGREIALLPHDGWVLRIAFSPDGRWLATGGRGQTARLFEATTGREMVPPIAHSGFVLALAFSADSRLLATGGGDDARVFEVATGNELMRITHEYGIDAVAFSPDGRLLATSNGFYISLWSTDLDEMIRQLCKERGRNLAGDEWQHYIGTAAPWSATCDCWETPSDVVAAGLWPPKENPRTCPAR